MGKKKFYSVKAGREVGIFSTWSECEAQVKGFAGAQYKGFETKDEAVRYMQEGEKEVEKIKDKKNKIINEKSEAVAYVDGSYDNKTKTYSYGVVMLHKGDEKHFSTKFNDKELALMRNVSGEVEGAKKAMTYCLENDIKTLDLYYDYEGIEKWCTEEWKAKNDFTKAYKQMYEEIKEELQITFYKVLAHSGDKYNDLADKLAKEAIKINDKEYEDDEEELEEVEEDRKNKIGKDVVCEFRNISEEKIDRIILCLDKNEKIKCIDRKETLSGVNQDYIYESEEKKLKLEYNTKLKRLTIEGGYVSVLGEIMNHLIEK